SAAQPVILVLRTSRTHKNMGEKGSTLKDGTFGRARPPAPFLIRLRRPPPPHLSPPPPQQGNDRRSLPSRRIFGDLLLCPRQIFRREGEFFRLHFRGSKSTDRHFSSVSSDAHLIDWQPAVWPDSIVTEQRTSALSFFKIS